MREYFRILAVDPGDKRLGIAVSDQTRTIASPLTIIKHRSREQDALAILDKAEEYQAGLILIGQALDWNGKVSQQGEKSARLAEVLLSLGNVPVILWNEYGSTAAVQKAQQTMNIPRKKRQEHKDHLAAAVILQSYLDAHNPVEDV